MKHRRYLLLQLRQERPQNELVQETSKAHRIIVLSHQSTRHDLLDPLQERQRRSKEHRDVERISLYESLVRAAETGSSAAGSRVDGEGRDCGGGGIGHQTRDGDLQGSVEGLFVRFEGFGRGFEVRVDKLEDLL